MSKEFNIKIRNVSFLHSYMLYINYMWFHFNSFGSPILYNKDLKNNDKDNKCFEDFISTNLGLENIQKIKEILSLIYSYETISLESLYKNYSIKEQTNLFDAINEIIIKESSFNNNKENKEYFETIDVSTISDDKNNFSFNLGQILSNRILLNKIYAENIPAPNFYFQKIAKIAWKNTNDLPVSFKTVNKKGYSVLQSISFDSNLNGIVDPNFITNNLISKLQQYKDNESFLNNLDSFIDLELGIRVVFISSFEQTEFFTNKDKFLKQNIFYDINDQKFLILPIKNCEFLTKESAELLKQNNIIDSKTYIKFLTQQEEYNKFTDSINLNYYNNAMVSENIRTLEKIYDIIGDIYPNISYSYNLTKNISEIIINKIGEFI